MKPDELIIQDRLDDKIADAVLRARKLRFVVSISSIPKKASFESTFFYHESKKCSIEGGFELIENLPEELILRNENNSLIIYDGQEGKHTIYPAPGAGSNYTASIMMGDALKLLGL